MALSGLDVFLLCLQATKPSLCDPPGQSFCKGGRIWHGKNELGIFKANGFSAKVETPTPCAPLLCP